MTVGRYLTERAAAVTGGLLLAVCSSLYLAVLGLPWSGLVWLDAAWLTAGALVLASDYMRKKRKEKKLCGQLEALDKKYLIAELSGKPADLICRNHDSEVCRRIAGEIRSIDGLVEQVLYYARSENVEKDYFIRETVLSDVVSASIRSFRSVILERRIRLEVGTLPERVWTDEKWMTFILNQIFSNAIKYADKPEPRLTVTSGEEARSVWLCVEDNGCGIRKEDLPRVFEKGFTGGARTNRKATGMGLYLSKKLCTRLGLALEIESERGKFTRVRIGFPVGRYVEAADGHSEKIFLTKL
ncbi:MAG TPA: hypothetical protein H9672_11100 [Firmicutes bacterium]|nr:hypothetical protein [Bacillota bacterium]